MLKHHIRHISLLGQVNMGGAIYANEAQVSSTLFSCRTIFRRMRTRLMSMQLGHASCSASH